jgi:hypothetical protein
MKGKVGRLSFSPYFGKIQDCTYRAVSILEDPPDAPILFMCDGQGHPPSSTSSSEMGLGVWNGPRFVHGKWNIRQEPEEIVREGKLSIAAPFDIIRSDLCTEEETMSEKETKLTHTCLNKSIPHENRDFILSNIQLLLVPTTGRVFEEVEQ